jgi:RNA polymerase sigma factor (sigma-70 family)
MEASGGTAVTDRQRTSGAGAPSAAVPTAAFEDLFRSQFAVILRLAHLLGADDPEDVAQEAFVRLHARWAGLRDPLSAGGYLRTTVVNLVRTQRRRAAMAVRRVPPAQPGTVASVEFEVIGQAGSTTLMAALARIAPRHREALVFRFWLDLSERQIADAMEVSVGSVKSHVSRGLSALRTELAGREDDR